MIILLLQVIYDRLNLTDVANWVGQDNHNETCKSGPEFSNDMNPCSFSFNSLSETEVGDGLLKIDPKKMWIF